VGGTSGGWGTPAPCEAVTALWLGMCIKLNILHRQGLNETPSPLLQPPPLPQMLTHLEMGEGGGVSELLVLRDYMKTLKVYPEVIWRCGLRCSTGYASSSKEY
jgi:hypothetical protein